MFTSSLKYSFAAQMPKGADLCSVLFVHSKGCNHKASVKSVVVVITRCLWSHVYRERELASPSEVKAEKLSLKLRGKRDVLSDQSCLFHWCKL